ncbi:MAG: GDP-L-fucose synthase [Candidatus Omnitrophota bacterium]
MEKQSKILIIGHNDIIEKSLVRYFETHGFLHVFSSSAIALDCAIQPSVYEFFSRERPEYIFLASTRSGGIAANIKNPGEFIYHNLESQNNVVHAAYKFKAKKLLFYASSCIYPKECRQPMKEEDLLNGPVESTSEAYAVAKISGVKLCQAYRAQYGLDTVVTVPATVFGPGEDVDLEDAHVLNALIGKFYEAVQDNKKDVTVWGSGSPRREFLFCDDFVEASLFLMDRARSPELMNMGCGSDVSIQELAQMIKEVSGFAGKIVFDRSKPDGANQKLLDSSRIHRLGWKAKISLRDGIEKTYAWYKKKRETESRQ